MTNEPMTIQYIDLGDGERHPIDAVTVGGKSATEFQELISDLSQIRAGATAGTTAYQKPSGGIPASDIAIGVIPDVSSFITKTVNDLTYYYTKDSTYTKSEVQALIGAISQFHYEIYDTLPATGVNNVLYLIGPTGNGTDKYEEYVYAGNTWTKIGDTSIDLSGYVTTTALNTALADYTLSVNIPVEKGTGTNSVKQKGTGAIAMSEASFAIGAATHSGTKGFRWTSWDKASLTFTLEKALPKAISNDTWLSIVNDSHYDKCCQVDGNVSAGSTTIKVKTSPFDSKVEGDTGYDAYIIMVVDDPTIGDIDLGQTAYAEGGNTKALQMFSHAEGYGTEALGQYSHTEGRENKAVYAAHAEGRGTEAMGNYSHTEGQTTKAYGGKSHAEGTQTETYANNSHTEGFRDIIKDGAGAHAEGYGNVIDITENTAVTTTTATGQSIGAHAEGVSNKVAGIGAHAEGRGNIVNEEAAHVEGKNNIASGRASHAEGFTTRAGNLDAPTEQTTATEGWFAHAEGNSTFAKGNASHAEGAGTKALARAAHAEGRHSIALGNYSHAEGFDVMAGKPTDDVPQPTTIINETEGFFAHAEGHHTLAKGNSSHAEGKNTEAAGIGSHAEGYGESERDGSDIVASNIIARGKGAHAEGCAHILYEEGKLRTYILAEGDGAHAEGATNNDDINSNMHVIARGKGAHAEGIGTNALADGAHAEGFNTAANGDYSHAEGNTTASTGNYSHTEGIHTIAYNINEHAEGQYNKSNKKSGAYGDAGNTQHSVGIGTQDIGRKNAHEIMQNGDHYVIGIGGYDGTNPASAKTLQQVIGEIDTKIGDIESILVTI